MTIRPTVEDDLETLFAFQADPDAARMAAFPSRDREAFHVHQRGIIADPTMLAYSVVADRELVGSIGTWTMDGDRFVSYWIGRRFWGRGYATEALRAMLAVDPARPLLAFVAVDNAGSRRVLEKCGFASDHERTASDGVTEAMYVSPS